MPRRGVIVLAGVAVALAVSGAIAWLDGGDGGKPATVPTSTLPARSVQAGAVEVKIQPLQLDAEGAVFKISFDTHSFELSADMTRAARLSVDGVAWTVAGWSGDGPGGHHREGELRFAPAGSAEGAARLTIAGLPEPVEATWDLGG